MSPNPKTGCQSALKIAPACAGLGRLAFTTAAALVHDLMEARDERSLQKHLASVKLLILDGGAAADDPGDRRTGDTGYVPFTAVGGELLVTASSKALAMLLRPRALIWAIISYRCMVASHLIAALAVGFGGMNQPQAGQHGIDCDRRWLVAARKDAEDHLGAVSALPKGFTDRGLDGIKPFFEHLGENPHEAAIRIIGAEISNPADRQRVKALLADMLAKGQLRTEKREDTSRHPREFIVVSDAIAKTCAPPAW